MILRWKESQVLFAYNYTFQLHRPTCHKLDFIFDKINILFCKYGFAWKDIQVAYCLPIIIVYIRLHTCH